MAVTPITNNRDSGKIFISTFTQVFYGTAGSYPDTLFGYINKEESIEVQNNVPNSAKTMPMGQKYPLQWITPTREMVLTLPSFQMDTATVQRAFGVTPNADNRFVFGGEGDLGAVPTFSMLVTGRLPDGTPFYYYLPYASATGEASSTISETEQQSINLTIHALESGPDTGPWWETNVKRTIVSNDFDRTGIYMTVYPEDGLADQLDTVGGTATYPTASGDILILQPHVSSIALSLADGGGGADTLSLESVSDWTTFGADRRNFIVFVHDGTDWEEAVYYDPSGNRPA